ncbi:MAG: hypothetical protein WC030_00300 [Candidatus Paceibacterota bacterium]
MPLHIGFVSVDGGQPGAAVTNARSATEMQASIEFARGCDGREKVVSFVIVEGVAANLLSALVGTELMADLENFLTEVHNA